MKEVDQKETEYVSIFGLQDKVKFKNADVEGTIRAICFRHRSPISVEVVYFDGEKNRQAIWVDDDEIELVDEEKETPH